MTTRSARASHTAPNGIFFLAIFRCVEYADFNLPVMSTRRPGAIASSWSERMHASRQEASALSDASMEEGESPLLSLPDAFVAAAAMATSAAMNAACAAAADFEFRFDARSRSNGGTHARSALSSSCSALIGLARFNLSSSATVAAAAARTRRAISSLLSLTTPPPFFLRSTPSSPRKICSTNICTSAPVGGSHVHSDLNRSAGVASDPGVDAPPPLSPPPPPPPPRSRAFPPPPRRVGSGAAHSSTRALMIARNASGSFTANARSSISAFAPNSPSASETGHHT
eukprot:31194-Pelagococcus_subviridis.AAC.19